MLGLGYQKVKSIEIPLSNSSFKNDMKKLSPSKLKEATPMVPWNNPTQTSKLVERQIIINQPRISPIPNTQYFSNAQATLLPSYEVLNPQIRQYSNQTIMPASFPLIPTQISNETKYETLSGNIIKSEDETEIEYPPETHKTIQEVVERKIVINSNVNTEILSSVNQPTLIQTRSPELVKTNLTKYQNLSQPSDEVATVREVIQRTKKIQPSPIKKIFKKEITERRIPITQYSVGDEKVSISDAQVISQEIIRQIKPEIKQQIILTQVPRQIVIPFKRQISGSPERHIVFGQERIVISPPRRVGTRLSPKYIRGETFSNAFQFGTSNPSIQLKNYKFPAIPREYQY